VLLLCSYCSNLPFNALYKNQERRWHCQGFSSTLIQNTLKLMPSLPEQKKWTGWDDLNPRPQLSLFQGCSFYLLSNSHKDNIMILSS
jgi:hypothetical protein